MRPTAVGRKGQPSWQGDDDQARRRFVFHAGSLIKQVQTVTGPVDADLLGFTLMQELRKWSVPGWQLDPCSSYDRRLAMDSTVAQLVAARGAGIKSLVDTTPIEIRDVEFIAEAARLSGVQVICATGLYTEPECPEDGGIAGYAGFPSYFAMLSQERVQHVYTTELTVGVGAQRVLPGIIKACTGSERITMNEAKALRAAALAAVETDTRITTHTSGTMGEEQLALLTQAGLPAHHARIGHCDKTHDLEYDRRLLRLGCYIGYDLVGHDGVCPDEVRAENIAQLVSEGFVRQLMLSQNHMACFHFGEDDVPTGWRNPSPKRRFTYIIEEFLPLLQGAGVTEADLHTIMIENPRRYFVGERP